jgi:hypothetical protein
MLHLGWLHPYSQTLGWVGKTLYIIANIACAFLSEAPFTLGWLLALPTNILLGWNAYQG